MNRPKGLTSQLLLLLWEKKWWWLTPMLLTFLALGILIQLRELPAPPQPSWLGVVK